VSDLHPNEENVDALALIERNLQDLRRCFEHLYMKTLGVTDLDQDSAPVVPGSLQDRIAALEAKVNAD
jgi:hypothetical protein